MTNSDLSNYRFRSFSEEYEQALVDLLKNNFQSFLQNGYWTWKHKLNPNFDPSLIFIAEKDGHVIGCNHWSMRELKLSNSLQVKAALGAEVLVDPNYRGHGLGTQLLQYPRVSGIYKDKKLILSYMFTDSRLNNRLHRPSVGYITSPSSTVTYKKFFNCQLLKEKFLEINRLIESKEDLKNDLSKITMFVTFKLKGAPSFTIHVENGLILLEDGEVENADAIIEGTLPLSYAIIDADCKIWQWIKAWAGGKLKIRKGLFKLLKMYNVFKIISLATR